MKRSWIIGLCVLASLGLKTASAQLRVDIPAGVVDDNRITKSYLGFASSNSLKTTTLTFTKTVVARHALVVIAGSGNYATSNWTGTVTDSASHTCTQIDFGANSTTQFAGAYVCPNETAVTSATFTIAGSSSSNTTTWLVAYDVGNVGPNLSDFVDNAFHGSASSGTAIALLSSILPTKNGSLILGAACAGGTISAGGTLYTVDSGIQAPASASGCVNMASQSVMLDAPSGITMPFTQGSAAWANVAIIIKPLSLTNEGFPHLNGTIMNTVGGAGTSGGNYANGVITEKGPRWMTFNNGASNTAATVSTGTVPANRIAVVDCIGFSIANNGTAVAAAGTANLTLTGSAQGAKLSIPVSWQTTAGLDYIPFTMSCGLNLASNPGESWTLAFSASAANVLQGVMMTGFNLYQTLTY
jgi:hypothetical protein